MTKLRDPDSLEYAIAKCLTVLRSEVKDVIGKSENYVQMCSDPDNDRQLYLRDAALLDRAMKARGEGQPIADAYLGLLEEVPSGRAGHSLPAAFMQISSKTGTLADVISEAMTDGVVDLHERRAIAEIGHALIERVRGLLDTLEPQPIPPSASPSTGASPGTSTARPKRPVRPEKRRARERSATRR